MNILNWFKKKSDTPLADTPDPKPGEVWLFSRSGPFGGASNVYVIQIKDGWVQYTHHNLDNIKWSDTIKTFKLIFTRVQS